MEVMQHSRKHTCVSAVVFVLFLLTSRIKIFENFRQCELLSRRGWKTDIAPRV